MLCPLRSAWQSQSAISVRLLLQALRNDNIKVVLINPAAVKTGETSTLGCQLQTFRLSHAV